MNRTMMREIVAQPEVLRAIQPQLAQSSDALVRPRGRVLAAGCGDSLFAGRALGEVWRRMGRPVLALSAMDLCGFVDIEASDTVILTSISGGTKRTVEAAEAARFAGAHVVAVTCNPESGLACVSSETLVLPFTPISRKTPHTLDYAVTLLALTEIGRSFAGLPADASAATLDDLQASLERAGDEARRLAAAADPTGKTIFLGAGPDLGTAEYAAAKFHEGGGLIALAAETENFVHGMNFLLEPEDTLVAIATSERGAGRAREVVDAFSGLVRQGATIVRPAEGDWQSAFSALLSATFVVQEFCRLVANDLGLAVEEPRAGRRSGEDHSQAQATAMAR